MLDKVDELIADLSQRPVTEILGVVGPNGARGGSIPGKDWIMTFKLSAWKGVDGKLYDRELTIRKPVSHDELKTAMKQLAAHEVVHLQVRLANENCLGTPQGLLVGIIRRGFLDADLDHFLTEIRKPVSFRDEKFGVLTLDRRFNWLEGEAPWGSERIKLHLEADEKNDFKRSLRVAHAIWDLQSIWEKQATELVVAKLLPLKNKSWLREDETDLSAEQFLSRIRLESITAGPGDVLEFWYHDGDIFSGHAIRVSGSLSAGITHAGIEG